MDLTYATVDADEALDPRLRADLVDTWVAASDAGGSVGFTPPTPVDKVAAAVDYALGRVSSGTDALGVLRTPDRTVGMGFLVHRDSDLYRHWRTVLRLMVHPEYQRKGAGSQLMRGLHELGTALGLQHLQLTVRDGEGLQDFYRHFGYEIVGRHPAAIRVAPGDDRDEVMMVAKLPQISR